MKKAYLGIFGAVAAGAFAATTVYAAELPKLQVKGIGLNSNTVASTVGGVELEDDNHGQLKAGETEAGEKTRIRWEEVEAYAGQSVFIYAIIDADNSVAESDESNNVSAFMSLDIA